MVLESPPMATGGNRATSTPSVDRYTKGRNILFQSPDYRSLEDIEFLKEWLLQKVSLFKQIDPESFEIIVENVTIQTYLTGEAVYEQDDPLLNFYVVLRGSLSMLADQKRTFPDNIAGRRISKTHTPNSAKQRLSIFSNHRKSIYTSDTGINIDSHRTSSANLRTSFYSPDVFNSETGNIRTSFVNLRMSIYSPDVFNSGMADDNHRTNLAHRLNVSRTHSINSAIKTRKQSRRSSKAAGHKIHTKKKEGNIFGKEVHVFFAGDYFGEEALLQREETALSTIRAKDEVELLVIHVSIFDLCLYSYFQEVFLQRAKFLSNIEWLKNVSPHLIRQLSFMLHERRHKYGECLYRQGMDSQVIRFIQMGSVKISTHTNKDPPEELVAKIEPPKDYLPEILAEDLSDETVTALKRSSISLNHRPSISLTSHSTTDLAGQNNNSLNSSLSASLLHQRRKSASSKHEDRKKIGQIISRFNLHHPNTQTNRDICVLGPGDTLSDTEAIMKLDKHLYNGVCVSDTTIYEMHRYHFEEVFEKKYPGILYQMLLRAIQKTELWGKQHSTIKLFDPLIEVLNNMDKRLVSMGVAKGGRKKPLYTPTMLASAAIKGLGKMSVEMNTVDEENGKFPPGIEESSVSTLDKKSDSKIQLSPFESQLVPDFESSNILRQIYLNKDSDNISFKSANYKNQDNSKLGIFDYPVPFSTIHYYGHNPRPYPDFKDSIPVPLPYVTTPVKPELDSFSSISITESRFIPSSTRYNNSAEIPTRHNTSAEGLPPLPGTENSLVQVTDMAQSPAPDMTPMPTKSNDPDHLARIRFEILSNKVAEKEDLSFLKNLQKRTVGKIQKSISMKERTISSFEIFPKPRSLSHDCSSKRKKLQGHKQSSNKMRSSVLDDNEATVIPKEYSSLCGDDGKSEDEDNMHIQKKESSSIPPYVKTMELMIENRLTQLTSKYRLSLAPKNTTGKKGLRRPSINTKKKPLLSARHPKHLLTGDIRDLAAKNIIQQPATSKIVHQRSVMPEPITT